MDENDWNEGLFGLLIFTNKKRDIIYCLFNKKVYISQLKYKTMVQAQKLTNLQVELVKMFAREIPDEQLIDIKNL